MKAARRGLRRLLLAAALLVVPALALATPPASWKASGLSVDAANLRLKDVLEQFAQVYDVRLALELKANPVMKGRFKADNGTDFLNRVAQAYPFRWFVYNDTLHIVPADDNISLRLEVGDDAVADARAAMIGVGLYDERFGWGELPDTGTVIVSGPRAYVHLARDILMPDTKKADSKARRVMMFRLKYASVTDRTINARGQSETIPGVKTILTNLLFGSQGGEKLADVPSVDPASNKRSRGPKIEPGAARQVSGSGAPPFLPIFNQQPNAAKASAAEAPAERRDNGAPRAREESGRPRIEADPALNAILIYDTADKRPMYASLIAELDVQPQQIEIEALIVDMDRSKLAEMGVEWGVRAGAVDTVVNGTAAASLGTALPVAGATLLISDAARFYARLKALEAKGDARVLATPTVLTIDNVAAVLDLSQSSYVSLVGERVADLADITAGTMLRVIPRIIREGAATRVRLEVDIEDGSLDNPNAGGTGKGANGNVNVTRSTISTQAIIDSQQTLMIGGYRAERLARDRQKVPVLGDLPLFGGLFRTESTSSSTRERLFLITPRLSGTSGVAAPAQSAASSRALAVAKGRAIIAAAEGNPVTTPAPAPAQRQEEVREAPMKPLLPAPVPRAPSRRADADGAVPPPPGTPPRTADASGRAASSPWALIPAAASARGR
ncbi:type III secretion system outer membrane ring subunit SctC [Pseudoduganella armeniaca]|uniref:type III secretion system outer membrane ring subunit SctC n=1 Tax=Pseudoduganella armeniaca TaxID=2072590 RepID=UPI001E42C1C8|nr:type III secretion system outer membrane ring subunit SctC [Pseudoduganella armeniaca]